MIDKTKDALHEHHHEEHCACGHDHHAHQHTYTPAEMQQMVQQKQIFNDLQAGVKKMQELHDKIDNVLMTVNEENVGLVLTQKKTLQELKSLAHEVFKEPNRVPLVRTLYEAEKDYIENVEGIMHQAQVLKNSERK